MSKAMKAIVCGVIGLVISSCLGQLFFGVFQLSYETFGLLYQILFTLLRYGGLALLIFGIVKLARKPEGSTNESEIVKNTDEPHAMESSTGAAISIIALEIGHEDIQWGWRNQPDSAGGVSVRICFENKGTVPIKYIVFYVVPYNRVDDIVSSTVSGKAEEKLKGTGPYEPKKRSIVRWGQVWYNHSIASVKITKIEIEYMDGSKKEIDANEIAYK